MATAIKTRFSQSSDGKAIKVVATATAGTLIHTATSNATPGAGGIWDEIWIWAFNSDTTTARNLTIEYGDATAPDHNIVQTIPPLSGAILIIPGLILQNGATVRAFAALTNVITIMGYVNQITN